MGANQAFMYEVWMTMCIVIVVRKGVPYVNYNKSVTNSDNLVLDFSWYFMLRWLMGLVRVNKK